MKKVTKIGMWIFIGLYVPVILSFISVQRHGAVCRSVTVSVVDSASVRFVTPNEVKNYVVRHLNGLRGSSVKQINLEKVEELVNRYPAVAGSDAYFTPEGVLRIVVKQRVPVLRVFENGSSYLLDDQGVKIPLRGSYSKRLLVVNGHVNKLKRHIDLVELDRFISDDSFLRVQIEQIFIDGDGDLLLVPRVGNHLINIGDVTDLEYKFRNLKALYEKGLHPLEWNSYKMINLKFKGQVICSKI